MSKNKVFCGLGKVVSGKRRGSSQECLENNQVHYYGLVKIDPEILIRKHKEVEKMEVKLAVMNIKMKKDYQLWKYEKDEKKKEKMKKKLKELAANFVELRDEMHKLEKKNQKLSIDKKKK